MQHYLIDYMIHKLQKPMTHSGRCAGVPLPAKHMPHPMR